MQEGNEITLTNLRLICTIGDGQYPTTTLGGNISGVYDNTYGNSFLSSLAFETWNATQFCLKKLYTEQLPPLLVKLNVCDDHELLVRVRDLIKNSIEGLKNIKKLYSQNKQREAWMDTIILDYAEMQTDSINRLISKNVEKIIKDDTVNNDDIIQ